VIASAVAPFPFHGGHTKLNRDGEIVTLLSLGMTRAQVAERRDIGERTVYRRLKDPEFQAQLDAARDVYQSAPPELKRLYASSRIYAAGSGSSTASTARTSS
jgi:hypothetical protein